MVKLSKQELQVFRDVRLHKILGLPDNGYRVSMPCPIHNGDKNNFNLYPDNSYYCFVCGSHGHSPIDFYKDMGISFKQTLEDLCSYI